MESTSYTLITQNDDKELAHRRFKGTLIYDIVTICIAALLRIVTSTKKNLDLLIDICWQWPVIITIEKLWRIYDRVVLRKSSQILILIWIKVLYTYGLTCMELRIITNNYIIKIILSIWVAYLQNYIHLIKNIFSTC